MRRPRSPNGAERTLPSEGGLHASMGARIVQTRALPDDPRPCAAHAWGPEGAACDANEHRRARRRRTGTRGWEPERSSAPRPQPKLAARRLANVIRRTRWSGGASRQPCRAPMKTAGIEEERTNTTESSARIVRLLSGSLLHESALRLVQSSLQPKHGPRTPARQGVRAVTAWRAA